MVQYKEFQGKTLDEAIREACEYFGVAREKLEIDIVSDAKTGIFGLVGAKKATIRAGRVDLPGTVDALLAENGPADAPERKGDKGESRRPARRDDGRPDADGKKKKQQARKDASPRDDIMAVPENGEAPESTDFRAPAKKGQISREPGKERMTQQAKRAVPDQGDSRVESGGPEAEDFSDGSREELPEFDLAGCDQEHLFAVVKEVVLRLVHPIVGDVPCTVAIAGSRVRAVLDCGDAAGLLVGRDGQTLAAVQYLASRIIARRIGGAVRLQVDAGKYRERQDDKLKEQALSLAQRVKETGRSMSTRPLTAYQRRIVHLALEQDEAVQTHSKGEGAQRKVTISLKRGNGKNGSEAGENKPAPQPVDKPRPARSAAGRARQKAHKPLAGTADDTDAL
ncbi:MAG: Jag N-terminal domain-containing protein [Desulfovibrionaceae bacterium]|nr:Jag N-terminal domain-containing protein [Desulfovibrionaceae bacterium]